MPFDPTPVLMRHHAVLLMRRGWHTLAEIAIVCAVSRRTVRRWMLAEGLDVTRTRQHRLAADRATAEQIAAGDGARDDVEIPRTVRAGPTKRQLRQIADHAASIRRPRRITPQK